MIVVKELRCRGCEGRLFVGNEDDGWRCVADGFEGVFVDVIKPSPKPRPRRRVVAAAVKPARGRPRSRARST